MLAFPGHTSSGEWEERNREKLRNVWGGAVMTDPGSVTDNPVADSALFRGTDIFL